MCLKHHRSSILIGSKREVIGTSRLVGHLHLIYETQSTPLPLGEPEENLHHGDTLGFKNSMSIVTEQTQGGGGGGGGRAGR